MTTPATARRPESSEYASYYAGYVNAVPEGDIVSLLREDGRDIDAALRPLSADRSLFRYAQGKWSIREVVGHMIDAERIFAYRALRMARGDRTPLPSFDENQYAAAAGSDARTLDDLLDEFRSVREATVRMFASFPADVWPRSGIASEHEVSVRAIAWIIVGHTRHHMQVLRDRYDLSAAV